MPRVKRGLSGLSLVVGVNKPAGMSSHDVVNRCRSIFGERRRHVLVAIGLSGVEHVAHAAVVADLASGDGDQLQTGIGYLEQQDSRDNLARLLVDLADA